MNKSLLRGLIFTVLVLPLLSVQAGQSAKEAAEVLPAHLRNNIVKISADNGTPDPPDWYFVCRAAHGEEGIISITVRKGKIVQQKPSLDLRVALGNYSRINLSNVMIDSRGAFAIAQRYVSKEKGATLGNASFLLQQAGEDASPIWSIWCYSDSVKYIGLLKILASTGDVILWE
jgi:hypothetical protein